MSDFYASESLRAEVRKRAQGCCEYCLSKMKFSLSPFVMEHVVPLSLGGKTASGNLALACPGCNMHKAVLVTACDPLTGVTVPIFHPRTQKWSDHFAWGEDFRGIIGRAPIGRATVEALQMNREGLQNLRGALKSVGCHPPASPPESAP
jgi:hypothetical protein